MTNLSERLANRVQLSSDALNSYVDAVEQAFGADVDYGQAVALHFAQYNLVRLHKTLRTTPAMAANVSSRLWSLEELVDRTSN